MESYNFSYWEMESFLAKADLIVVGSGIVGLSSAFHYKKANPSARVVILERGMLPTGASTRNAGFACFGSVSEIADDLEKGEAESVWATVAQRFEGLQLLRSILGDSLIQYQASGGVELFRTRDDYRYYCECADQFNSILKQRMDLDKVYQWGDSIQSSFSHGFAGAIMNKYEGLLHPGAMMKNFLDKVKTIGVECYFGAEVLRIEQEYRSVRIVLQGGHWEASKVILATNGFARRLMPELDVKPARNWVLVTEEIPDLPFSAGYHLDAGYIYFRPVGKRLLLGGARHIDMEAEETDAFGENEKIKDYLAETLQKEIMPTWDAKIAQSWSGIMGVGTIKKPIVKMVEQDICVAVRMGGMGVAIGSLIGKQASDCIRFGQ